MDIVEERIRVIQRGVPLRGKWRDGRRVVDRECIGERPTQEQCGVRVAAANLVSCAWLTL